MFKLLALFYILSSCLALEHRVLPVLSLEKYDEFELSVINAFNQERDEHNLKPVVVDEELSQLAQAEAERLVKLGRLDRPDYSTFNQSVHGYTFKVNGIINDTYYGSRMCHNNMIREVSTKIYDVGFICFEDKIDWRMDYKVGFGRAYDEDQNIYGVRLYLSKQKRESNVIGKFPTVLVKPTIELYVNDTKETITDYNQMRVNQLNFKEVEMDRELMDIAQAEAERLVKLGKLELPSFSALDGKLYAGSSDRIVGKINENYIGTSMCFNNIFKEVDHKIYDFNDICNPLIPFENAYKVGFGQALSEDKNVLYSVLFYLIKQ